MIYIIYLYTTFIIYIYLYNLYTALYIAANSWTFLGENLHLRLRKEMYSHTFEIRREEGLKRSGRGLGRG